MRRLMSGILLLALMVVHSRAAFAASIPSPVALTANGGDGVIELAWQYGYFGDYPDLSYFRVYRSIDGGSTFCLYASVQWSTPGADPFYADTAPPASGATVYYVTAVDTAGSETERSNTAAAYPTAGGVQSPTCTGGGGGTLQPPGAVVISGQATGGTVNLSWSAPPSGGAADGYRVYRDGQQFTQTSGTSHSGSYTVDGSSHYWYVIAYNAAGAGPESNRVWSSDSGGDPPPQLPGAPVLSGQLDGASASLSWTAPSGGDPPTSYRVYQDGVFVAETQSLSYSASWDGGPHTYQVRAVNAAGEGPASNSVTLQAPADPVLSYLQNPAPLPPPPPVPIGPSYAPPAMPDLRPVMPRLGQRTGRTLPPVVQFQVPPDIPAPPALPPIEDPSISPWGMPIGPPGTAEVPLQPVAQTQPQAPGTPRAPLPPSDGSVPQAPLAPSPAPVSAGPKAPAAPLSPATGLSSGVPLTPAAPLTPNLPAGGS